MNAPKEVYLPIELGELAEAQCTCAYLADWLAGDPLATYASVASHGQRTHDVLVSSLRRVSSVMVEAAGYRPLCQQPAVAVPTSDVLEVMGLLSRLATSGRPGIRELQALEDDCRRLAERLCAVVTS